MGEGGHLPGVDMPQGEKAFEDTEGTTILAVRYSGGVLVAGDRRIWPFLDKSPVVQQDFRRLR